MTKDYKNVSVPLEVYELIRAAAFRQHVPISHILRDLAATLTAHGKRVDVRHKRATVDKKAGRKAVIS